MAKDRISEYDATAGNNTVVGDVDINEGNAPSTVNNALREILSHLADAYAGDEAWDSLTAAITSGSTQSQAGATQLNTIINQVTVSGTDGDGVKLPPAVAGTFCIIANDDAAQTIQVWPATDDSVDSEAANAVDPSTIKAGGGRIYYALNATNWRTIANKNAEVSTASATAEGLVELATDAETVTGSDTARATTPANITAKMAAPGAIGGTTPSSGAFTTVTATTPIGVASGGTGATSLTDGGVLLGSNTGAVTAMSVLADGEFIVGDGTTDPVAESGATARASLGLKAYYPENLLDNPNFQTAQRATSVASVGSADGYFTVDRWGLLNGTYSSARFTMSQNALSAGTDEPADHGHAFSAKFDCTTDDASPAAGDRCYFVQRIEGFNVQVLAYGDASAKATVVGFWHKHTKTGTHAVALWRAAGAENISANYTQSVTNTWEYSEVTFVGNTATALDNDSSNELQLVFVIYAGSNYTGGSTGTWANSAPNQAPSQVNNADSTDNNFEIAGPNFVPAATIAAEQFKHEPISVTMAKCLRYFNRIADGNAKPICTVAAYTTLNWYGTYNFPVTMRADPTLAVSSAAHFSIVNNSALTVPSSIILSRTNTKTYSFKLVTAARTAGHAGDFVTSNASATLDLDAEL